MHRHGDRLPGHCRHDRDSREPSRYCCGPRKRWRQTHGFEEVNQSFFWSRSASNSRCRGRCASRNDVGGVQCLGQADQRLLGPARGQQSVAKVVVGRVVVRLQADCLTIAGDGLVGSALHDEGGAEVVVVGLGELRHQPQCFAVADDGAVRRPCAARVLPRLLCTEASFGLQLQGLAKAGRAASSRRPRPLSTVPRVTRNMAESGW